MKMLRLFTLTLALLLCTLTACTLTAAGAATPSSDMAQPYTDLVTAAEVAAASGSLSIDLQDAPTEARVESLCQAVTDEIEQHLDRELIVRAVTMRTPVDRWRTSPREAGGFEIYAPAWPVVEASTAGVTLGKARPGGQLLYAESREREIAGFAGFRRADQVLSGAGQGQTNLQSEDGLGDLSTLPPLIPGLIRQVAIDLVLMDYQADATGAAYGRRTIRLPQGGVEVEGQPLRFDTAAGYVNTYRQSRLRALSRFRRLA